MSAAKWYYKVGDQKYGPVTSQELRARAIAGEIRPENLVWKEGLPKWVPASRVDQLFSGVPSDVKIPLKAEDPPKPRAEVRPAVHSHDARPSRAVKSTRQPKQQPVAQNSAPPPPPRPAKVEKELIDDFESLDLLSLFEDDLDFGLDAMNIAAVPYTPPREEKEARQQVKAKKKKKKKRRRRNRSGDAAGFGKRLLATIIDGVILTVIMVPLSCLISVVIVMVVVGRDGLEDGAAGRATIGPSYQIALNALNFTIIWLYNAVLHSSSSQATLGKSLLRMRVTDLDGNPIDFWHATARHFAKVFPIAVPLFGGTIWLSSMPRHEAMSMAPHVATAYLIGLGLFFLGHLIQPFTPRGQAFHDLFSGTLVVND